MDAGKVLATETPAELIRARGARNLEDAFISYLEQANAARSYAVDVERDSAEPTTRTPHAVEARAFSPRWIFAYTIRESLELIRDPIRLGFALLGTAFLMLIFGFGITTDVSSLSFAVLDRDNTFESRAYLEELRGSPYFVEQAPLKNYDDLQRRLSTGEVAATVEIPPGFGRDIRRGRPTEVGAWVDGAMPFRAETIRGYLMGVHQQYLTDPVIKWNALEAVAPAAVIETRFRYNQDFDSIFAMVPSMIAVQVDADATAMVQAGIGSGYAEQIIATEINDFLSHAEGTPVPPVNLAVRVAFNPNVTTAWFTAVMGIINSVTMLAIILAGAAVVRESEHGTMDHLLVMPLTPFEIAMSKIWANGVVIIVAVGLSLSLVVRKVLGIPISGSILLFMSGVAIYLFFATAVGIFLATIARTTPQLGLLYILVAMPLNLLSGSNTPLESMPPWLATIMQASPSPHFIAFAQAILYRGAGFDVVWPKFVAVGATGALFLGLALVRFRGVAAQTT